MAWLAADLNGDEYIYSDKPKRNEQCNFWQTIEYEEYAIFLPAGSIKKLTGEELAYKDEPVEI